MSRIEYRHDRVERFVVGTVGLPGERSFFLQIQSSDISNCVAIEKSQVAALSERFQELIRELKRSQLASLDELGLPGSVDDRELEFPITEDFQVGLIGISWDGQTQRVGIEIQAFVETETEGLDELEDLVDTEEPDAILASLRIHQVRAFCKQADRVVASGRAPCPFCGLPVDAMGHLCPRSNGYRR
ncbi:MAG: DUF3090 family protein [Actinomycetes bacterium]